MTRLRLRLVAGVLLACVLLTSVLPGSAQEQPQPRSHNVDLVAYSDLGGRARNSAVWGHRSYAYVGSGGTEIVARPAVGPTGSEETGPAQAVPAAADCEGSGVAVVDLSTPTQPRVVGSLGARPGTATPDIQTLTTFGRPFTGDLLAVATLSCSTDASGGLGLWDVTDPRRPAELGFFDLGAGLPGVSEVALFRRGEQTIALLAAPFSESLDSGGQGDVRIVDVTDPRAPVQLADWGIGRAAGIGPAQGRGLDRRVFAAGVSVSPDGRRAYVAYWDAGVAILDIADLRAPLLIGRAEADPAAEGNSRSTAPIWGSRVLVETVDRRQPATDLIGLESGEARESLAVSYGGTREYLPPGEGIRAVVVSVGRACPARPASELAPARPADAFTVDPLGHVAAVDPGGCDLAEKVVRLQSRGAVAVIAERLVPREAGERVGSRDVVGQDAAPPPPVLTPPALSGAQIPVGLVTADAAARLAERLAVGEVTVHLSRDLRREAHWGGARFWDLTDPAQPVLLTEVTLATLSTTTGQAPPAGQAPPPAQPEAGAAGPVIGGAGVHTAYRPVVLGDRAYISWFAEGVRVLDLSAPTAPREVGYFIPGSEPGHSPGGAAPASTAVTPPPATLASTPPATLASTPPATPVAPAATGSGAAPAAIAAAAPPPPAIVGVFARGDLTLATDRWRGLYVLRDRPR